MSTQPASTPTNGMAIVDLVMIDILNRKAEGIKRYGTPLQAFNGRDSLRDAYDEAVDLAIYLRQLIEEREAKTVQVEKPFSERLMERVPHQLVTDPLAAAHQELEDDHDQSPVPVTRLTQSAGYPDECLGSMCRRQSA